MIESVLIFARATPHHHTGGMETLAWSLAAEWAKVVSDVQIVTTAVPGARESFSADGVTVVPLSNARPGVYSSAWWDESLAYWRSRKTAPSVVLSVSAGAYSVVRERSRHPQTPFVMQAHGTSAMEIASKLRAHDLRSVATAPKNVIGLVRDLARYRDFDRIVAVGENVVQSLVAKPQSWSVPPDKVRLIPNGVRAEDHGFDARARAEVRSALGIDDGTTVVGCIGRMHVQKRLDRALRGAAMLRDRGCADQFRFVLVGDGPDEGRLRGLVRELHLEDMVVFVGRVEPDSVRKYYAAADVSLLTTARLEGLPMAVLEALACGLPCVVPTGAVGSQALRGVLHEVDAGDPGLLADALKDVAPARGARASLLPSEFLLEQCAKDYLTLFGELGSLRRG
ncbi:glycosyltransferase family 4 protein [Micromonospora sp. NPDC049679]|uniref:glycosyltransferase family 4 protein n=1 Tax=Micromonospora sp. NPDC049679 TaxID=3155920 RepID=UPI0033C1BB5B